MTRDFVGPVNFYVKFPSGKKLPFDKAKLYCIVRDVFIRIEGSDAIASDRVEDICNSTVHKVIYALTRSRQAGDTFHCDDVNDFIELTLLRGEHFKAAREFKRL